MIDVSKLNQEFHQQDNSCVFSSYAIVANYYTGISIQQIFVSYCQHFNIEYSDIANPEFECGKHINDYWRKELKKG